MIKRRVKPIKVGKSGGSLADMIAKSVERARKAAEYVEKTGLCSACKKHPAMINSLICTVCNDEKEEALKQLRGPGFMELSIPITRK